MATNYALEDVIARVGDLPALPDVVARVLQMTDDPNSAIADITAAVENDPGLTAKILRLSNSPYYGMRQYVGTLKLAMVILGVREVRNIVLGISVFDTFNQQQGNVQLGQQIWDEALKTAALARHLAKHLGLGMQGEEFITGLISDIGKMVMVCQLGEPYVALYGEHRGHTRDLLAAEEARFGFTHTDAASALAVKWNLPQTLSDALWRQYPDPDRPLLGAKDPRLAAVVRVAKMAVQDDFKTPAGSQESLLDEEAWEVLAQGRYPVAAAERYMTLKTLVEAALRAGSVQLD